MESTEASHKLSEALVGTGWPSREICRNADIEAAIAAAKALVGKVADGSNLTLDLDLDSYYVMDVVTTKLPELMDRLGTIAALVRRNGPRPSSMRRTPPVGPSY
jgi:hypothetical protein